MKALLDALPKIQITDCSLQQQYIDAINTGTDVDTPINELNETMLFEACRANNAWLCFFLLENGANISHCNSEGKMAFDFFSVPGESLTTVLDGGRYDRNIYIISYDFNRLLQALKTNPSAKTAVQFLRADSDVLFSCFISYTDANLAYKIYDLFPYLIDSKKDGKSIFERLSGISMYAHYMFKSDPLELRSEYMDFLLKVKKHHPRKFFEFVIKDKRLVNDLLGTPSDVKDFADAHGCQDLIPLTTFESLTSTIRSLFKFEYHTEQKAEDVPNAEISFDIEEGKGKYPVADLVQPEASTKRLSLRTPLLRFTRRSSQAAVATPQPPYSIQDADIAAIANLPVVTGGEVITANNEPASARKQERSLLPA